MHTSKMMTIVLAIAVLIAPTMSAPAQTQRSSNTDRLHQSQPQPVSPSQIARNTFPSVVLIVVNDSNGQPLALGSGFFVQRSIIATNLHVIEGASSGYVKVVGQEAKTKINGIVASDSQHDLTLLSVESNSAPPLPFGDSDSLSVGDNVYAVGNPRGLEGTFSQGIISSIRHVESDTLLQITAPISPGSSGGPILGTTGKVVGVSEGAITDGQNLNFAIPVGYLASLIQKIGDVQPLSAASALVSKTQSYVGNRDADDLTLAEWHFDRDCLAWIAITGSASCGNYTFSLRNKLKDDVKSVYGLIVFLDKDQLPVDVDVVNYSGVIPAGLAKRMSSRVDKSVAELTKFAQFRVLDFEVLQ